MKIAFHTQSFYPKIGGLEKVTQLWAEALTQLGHEVCVITSTSADAAGDRRFPFKVLRQASVWNQLETLRKYECVIQMDISLKGLPVCLLSGNLFILSHHTALSDNWSNASFLQQFKRLLSNRLPVKNISCSRFIGNDLENSQVIHSPYDDRVFPRGHYSNQPYRFLFVGRLVSNKGVDVLLNAFALQVRDFPEWPGKLRIAGDGPEMTRLVSQTAGLGLSDRVVFLGALSPTEVAREMQEAETLVVPSRIEPFGTVVAEGLASGCRIICSNAGGLPEAGEAFATYFENGKATELAGLLSKASNLPKPEGESLQAFLRTRSAGYTARELLKLLEEMLQS